MGYRSQVRIVLRKADYDDLVRKLNAKLPEENYMFDKKEVPEFVYQERDNGNIVLFGWDSIKWYHEFKGVSFIEKYLQKLQEKDIPFKFVSMGEDGASEENYSDCIFDDDEYSEKFDIIQPCFYIDVLKE